MRFTMLAASAVIVAASAILAPSAMASTPDNFACTENQKAEIRQDIARECGGSGTARVYCSWMGLYEIRGIVCMT
jgi:hypothetical protein